MKIHLTPGLDAEAATRDLLKMGAVGIDDIGENLYDVIYDEIRDLLGHAADEMDLKEQRINTTLGPVFVLRDAERWSAARTRKAVLADRGGS